MPVNGNLSKWLLGALLSVVLFVGGLFASVIDSRLIDVEGRMHEVEQTSVRCEAEYTGLATQLNRIETKLDNLDDKLDSHLIESR